MILTAQMQIPGNAFLREVVVSSVDAGEVQGRCDDDAVAAAINACRVKAKPMVICKPASDSVAAIACLPVLCANELKSIVTFVVRREDSPPSGVFEVWSPMGIYADLNLTEGYFAGLDRFQNVSSHVQFEKGAGLPGQAWNGCAAVIHDHLSEHPGFVRAAGASADALETAIGIPVFSDRFVATMVLISGRATPLAHVFEVWKPIAGDQLELTDCAYANCVDSLRLKLGSTVGQEVGLVGLAAQHGTAVASCDPEEFLAEQCLPEQTLQQFAQQLQGGIAIPSFVRGELACITRMVL